MKRVPFGDPVKMVVGRGLRESKAAIIRFDVRLYKGLHHLCIRSPLDRDHGGTRIKDELSDHLRL